MPLCIVNALGFQEASGAVPTAGEDQRGQLIRHLRRVPKRKHVELLDR